MRLAAAAVLVAVAGLALAGFALADDDAKVPAEAKKWTFDEKACSLERSVKGRLSDKDVAIVGSDTFGERTLELRDKEKKLLFSVKVHTETPLVRTGAVLFVPIFSPIASGCAVAAYDLENGTKLWETGLDGIGPTKHSKYRNRVNVEIVKDVLVVRGEEAHGRYVECLDLKTGKVLWHEKLKGP